MIVNRASSGWRILWREHPLRSALGKRILLWLLLLSLVPLFISTTIGYLASSGIIHRLARRDLEALTAVQAHHTRDEIERLLLNLASAARNDRLLAASVAALRDTTARPVVLSAASGLATEELEQLRRQLQVFTSVELVDPAGVIVAASPRFASGLRWRERAVLVRAAVEGRTFAAERTGAPPMPRMLFAVSMAAPDSTRPVIVVGAVGTEEIAAALQIPPLLAGAVEGFVVDEAGLPLVVSHPHGPTDYTRPLPLFVALSAGVDRYRDAERREEMIGATHAVPGYPLRFVSQVPVHAALGALRGLRLLSVVLGAAFVLVVIAVGWIVSRGIVRPVYELVSATERLGHGDLAASVDVAQHDELGLLGQRFNAMAAQLRESAARIGDLHAEEMRRAEQLATVGELAAGIAHELKTPLLGIAGGVQLLSRRLDPADAEGRRLIEETMHRIERMEGTVQELLNYTRPAPARLSRLDLNAIVERALRLVEPRAHRSGVEIRRTLGTGLPPVLVDPEQINQVIVNLAVNGIEAMDGGGRLDIGTRGVDGGVELWVSDSGPGVRPVERERVFRPFYTTKHAGTGLGLAIVRQIVERHGGQVNLAEEPGGGARFVVSLPVDAVDRRSGGEA